MARKEKGSADKPLARRCCPPETLCSAGEKRQKSQLFTMPASSVSVEEMKVVAEMVESRGFWVAWRYRKNQNRDAIKQAKIPTCNQDKGFGVLLSLKKTSAVLCAFRARPRLSFVTRLLVGRASWHCGRGANSPLTISKQRQDQAFRQR
ncbi:MAG: hypothetical protein C0507_15855 [Cyanobacteria bacterium PR.3.49]|nr:hypothetical protein [Cyanobacteria bacterium PR.3.49]